MIMYMDRVAVAMVNLHCFRMNMNNWKSWCRSSNMITCSRKSSLANLLEIKVAAYQEDWRVIPCRVPIYRSSRQITQGRAPFCSGSRKTSWCRAPTSRGEKCWQLIRGSRTYPSKRWTWHVCAWPGTWDAPSWVLWRNPSVTMRLATHGDQRRFLCGACQSVRDSRDDSGSSSSVRGLLGIMCRWHKLHEFSRQNILHEITIACAYS